MDESWPWSKGYYTPRATLGEPALHSFYFTLTGAFIWHISHLLRVVGSPWGDRVTLFAR